MASFAGYVRFLLNAFHPQYFNILFKETIYHGSHRHWKNWKNGKAFFSQGILSGLEKSGKSQGILLKILEKSEKNYIEKLKKILEKSVKFVSQK